MGIERNSSSPVYSETEYNVGETYLAVVKFAFDPDRTTRKDSVWLYVTPTDYTNLPATADATYISDTGYGPNQPVQGVLLSQSSITSSGVTPVTIGSVRVSTEYANLFVDSSTLDKSPVITSDSEEVDLGRVVKNTQAQDTIIVRGTDLTGDITATSDNDEITFASATLSADDAQSEDGAKLVINLTPTTDTNSATITLSTTGGKDVTVAVTWTALDKADDKYTIPWEPITEQPDGKVTTGMVKHSLSWGKDSFGSPTSYTSDFAVTSVVEAEDGAIYVYNPFGTTLTGTWLKGYTTETDTVVFIGTQPIGQETVFGYDLGELYAVKMKANTSDDSGSYYVVDSTDVDIKMILNDGKLTWAEPTDGSVILGLVDESNTWMAVGDFNFEIYPQEDVANAAPQDVEYEQYLLTSDSSSVLVDVAISGSDIYVKGFSALSSELVMHGTIDGDKATFVTGQYMGIEESIARHIYAFATQTIQVEQEDSTTVESFKILQDENLVMSYDSISRSFSVVDKGFDINIGKYRAYYLAYFKEPSFTYFEEVPVKPATPIYSSATEERIVYAIRSVGVNGEFMLTDKIYYLIYINGEKLTTGTENGGSPYFFDTNTTGELTGGYYLINYHNGWRELQYGSDVETVGFQTVYLGGGVETYSDILTVNIQPSAINDINSDDNTPVEYYDISGRRLKEPIQGLNIVRLANGKTEKRFIK